MCLSLLLTFYVYLLNHERMFNSPRFFSFSLSLPYSSSFFTSRSPESMNFPFDSLFSSGSLCVSRTVDFAYMHVQCEWQGRENKKKSSHIFALQPALDFLYMHAFSVQKQERTKKRKLFLRVVIHTKHWTEEGKSFHFYIKTGKGNVKWGKVWYMHVWELNCELLNVHFAWSTFFIP